jgi:hypothetical protein
VIKSSPVQLHAVASNPGDVSQLCRIIAARCLPAMSVVGLLFAAPAQAAVIYVKDKAVGIAADYECSIVEAINAANSNTASADLVLGCPAGDDLTDGGDTIVLPAGGAFDIPTGSVQESITALPPLTSKIVIEGNGAVVSRTLATRLMHVTPGADVTLRSLTLHNAYSPAWPGGGIANDGTVTLENCLLDHNEGRLGGGIYNAGTLTVRNSTISGNVGTDHGGGIYQMSGTATISDSTITDNRGFDFTGGGIMIVGGTMTVERSLVGPNNRSFLLGGGIRATTGAVLTVANSTVNGNSGRYAAGIQAKDSTLTLLNTTIAANVGRNARAGSPANGLGLDLNNVTATVTNTIVAGNTDDVGINNCFYAGTTVVTGSNNLADDGTCGGTFTNSPTLNLVALADNSGPTQTQALGAGSSAIGAGDVTICTSAPVNSLDQRGLPRDATHCDVGAYQSMDEAPDVFSFTDATNVASHVYVHGSHTFPGGLFAGPITISGDSSARYSVSNTPFTAAPGVFHAGDNLRVRLVSATAAGASVDAIVTIGGVTDTFTATTGTDTTPKAFALTDQTGVAKHKYIYSNSIKVTGINSATPVSVTGGALVSVNSAAFTASPPDVVANDRVRLRLISSASGNDMSSATLTVGGVSDQWDVTTGP